jgi:hypothetical protein
VSFYNVPDDTPQAFVAELRNMLLVDVRQILGKIMDYEDMILGKNSETPVEAQVGPDDIGVMYGLKLSLLRAYGQLRPPPANTPKPNDEDGDDATGTPEEK